MSTDPRRVVDDYLTRTARKAFPQASVTVRFESEKSKDYQLEIPGEQPFVLGTVFGQARAMLRAIVSEHLPSQAARNELLFEPRIISDERKPGAEDQARALRIGVALRDESNTRSDAVLSGKLLALGAGGGAFTIEDLRSLRKHGKAKGQAGADYGQLADAIAYWCDLTEPAYPPGG